MNILITCDRLDTLGGLEEHVTDKIVFLLDKGYNVHLDCNAVSQYYADKILHKNLSISSPWSDNWNDVWLDIGDFKPDIIHAHPFSAVNRGYILKQKFDVPFFITIHGEYGYVVPHSVSCIADKIILVNDKINGYERYKTTVIPNGIDIKRFYNRNPNPTWLDTKDIVVATRLQDNKEIPVFKFLSACRYLNTKVNVHIVGDGKYLDEVKEKIKIMNLPPDKIQFNVMGGIGNIEEYYNFADLVLGCDRVALEALCCGVPVFYMGQGHFKDLIEINNYNDFLFSNRGILEYSHRQLARSIDMCLNHRVNEIRISELSSEIRDNFSIDSQMEKILFLYKDAIKER